MYLPFYLNFILVYKGIVFIFILVKSDVEMGLRGSVKKYLLSWKKQYVRFSRKEIVWGYRINSISKNYTCFLNPILRHNFLCLLCFPFYLSFKHACFLPQVELAPILTTQILTWDSWGLLPMSSLSVSLQGSHFKCNLNSFNPFPTLSTNLAAFIITYYHYPIPDCPRRYPLPPCISLQKSPFPSSSVCSLMVCMLQLWKPFLTLST